MDPVHPDGPRDRLSLEAAGYIGKDWEIKHSTEWAGIYLASGRASS